MQHKSGVQTNYPLHLFFICLLLCSHYIADLIKKLELCLMVVSDLLKIEFGHTQISVPKIGIPMSKTACINPWNITRKFQELSSWAHIIFIYIYIYIYISYNEINDKIVKQPKKQGKKMKLYIFSVGISHFCFRQALHLFRLLSAPQNGVGYLKIKV